MCAGDHGPLNSWWVNALLVSMPPPACSNCSCREMLVPTAVLTLSSITGRDRQPFAMSRSPTALPIPAVTTTRNNFIFADYQGVKALDHDDGSRCVFCFGCFLRCRLCFRLFLALFDGRIWLVVRRFLLLFHFLLIPAARSFFNDTQNVIYMGWGQKTFLPAPGGKRTWASLILFTSSVLTEHGGEVSKEYGEHFYNNTVVFKPGTGSYGKVDSVDQIKNGMMDLYDNQFFVSDARSASGFGLSVGKSGKLGLKQLQALGAEQGSTLSEGLPSDAKLVAMAKAMLLMN